MNEQNLQNRNEVKTIKFHHRVKRFYHKNLFRKIYTVAIVGLIAANIFSMVKYSSFADDVYTNGKEHNNARGGGGDNATNGYDSGNDRSERQGPCPDGWHVPSRGERNAISIAWCHYSDDCDDGDLKHTGDWTSHNNLIYTDKSGLGSAFRSDFGMSMYIFWSSSPSPDYTHQAWNLDVYDYVKPSSLIDRSSNNRVRCLKNSTDVVENGYGGSSTPSLTTTSEGYVLTDDGKSYTLALNDLDGYYYRGASENTDNTTWVDPNEGDGNGYGYGGGEHEACTITVDGNDYSVNYGESYSDSVYSEENSNSCSSETVSCESEGSDLGTWYSSCHSPCTINVDGNEYSVNYGESYSDSVYLEENSNSCSSQTVSCDSEGNDLGSWYSNCTVNGNGYGYGYGYGGACISGEEWNTATLNTNADGDYELTYDGTTYTIESGDLEGTYQRGINTQWVSHQGVEHNNDWGGSGDVATNGYDSGNDRSERQGPCPSGWHIPSRGEWAEIAIARCNQTDNSCDPSSDLNNVDSYGNLNYISKNGLGTAFRNSFGMSDYLYWSSSPSPGSDDYAWYLNVGDYYIYPDGNNHRNNNSRVRCLKNSIGVVSDTSSLGLITNGDGDYELIYNGKKYTIAGSDLGTYKRGSNDSIKNGIENNNVWGGGNDTVENGYDAGNPSSQRQGPCGEGYHVPSRGEWNSIATAWCHLSSNECTSCDLKHADNWTESNNLIYVYSNNYSLGSDFRTNFGMSDYSYWSSSPYPDNDISAWYLGVNDGYIYPYYGSSRNDNYRVRCLKNSIDDEPTPSTFTLTFAVDPEGYGSVSYTSITADEGVSITVAGDTVTVGNETVQATAIDDTDQCDYEFVDWTNNCGNTVSDNCTITANFKRTEISTTPTPSYSGGGGRKAETVKNMHNAAEEKDSTYNDAKGSENSKTPMDSSAKASEGQTEKLDVSQYNSTYTPEQNSAYQFAKSHGITTTSSIREAKMNTPLTRIEMAKMLSYYAMNVLGQTPDASVGVVKFRDITNKLDAQYDNAVTLAYQLGIMGINMPNNEFRPNDKVTRAEFATALSRMIYEMEDGTGRLKYYEPHIARLYNEGIINVTNPKMLELRGNVMMMLMRTEK